MLTKVVNVVCDFEWSKNMEYAITKIPMLFDFQKSSSSKPTLLPFKERFTLPERKHASRIFSQKHPKHVPVIIEPGRRNEDDDAKYGQFLFSSSMTTMNLIQVVGTKYKLNPYQGIRLYLSSSGNIISPSRDITLETLHRNYKDPDGFLYISLFKEDTFG